MTQALAHPLITSAPIASGQHIAPGRTTARRPVVVLLAMLLALTSLAACAGESEAQLANDALTAGLAAHQAGNLTLAAQDYREVLKHDPQNKYAYFDLGVIAQTQNQPSTAENDYRIALSIDPNFTSALWNLAIIRAAAGDPQEAISLWQEYLKLDSTAAGAHWNLAVLLRSTGQKAAGDAEMARALQLDPSLKDPAATGSAPSPGGAAPAGSATSSP